MEFILAEMLSLLGFNSTLCVLWACWVGSDSWQPHVWVMSIMSCFQKPWSAPIDSWLWLFLFMFLFFLESIHFVFCSCWPLFFPALFFCKKTPPSRDVPDWNKTTSVLSFLSLVMFQAYFALESLFLFACLSLRKFMSFLRIRINFIHLCFPRT